MWSDYLGWAVLAVLDMQVIRAINTGTAAATPPTICKPRLVGHKNTKKAAVTPTEQQIVITETKLVAAITARNSHRQATSL